MLWLFCFNVNLLQSQSKLYHSADLCTFILDNSCLVQFMRYMHVPAEQWAMTNFTAYFFFLQINLHIMRRMLSTTFIPCIHGKIRFLRSEKKKNRKQKWGIDSWNRIPSIPEPGIGIVLDSQKIEIEQPYCVVSCWNVRTTRCAVCFGCCLVTHSKQCWQRCGEQPLVQVFLRKLISNDIVMINFRYEACRHRSDCKVF